VDKRLPENHSRLFHFLPEWREFDTTHPCRSIKETIHEYEPQTAIKERKMKANVYDTGQALELPQPNESGKPAPRKAKAPVRRRSAGWLGIAGLLLLSAIPITAGAFRLNQLASGAEITPANARFFAMPLPVIVHIIGASLFAVLGAFQFSTAFCGAGAAGTA
jgi:hypothetical protein